MGSFDQQGLLNKRDESLNIREGRFQPKGDANHACGLSIDDADRIAADMAGLIVLDQVLVGEREKEAAGTGIAVAASSKQNVVKGS